MARLNEAPAPVESHLDILRRKFLRQNRDIAKINSDQSQKIRRLENDCARLLSENLELRGHILRLEKQVQDNSARRIADHALEIKAKLEAQLAECASLLGSLGLEPPSKRHSPQEGRLEKPRPGVARSPPQRKRRQTGMDAETLAEQEGRLPPIYENKTYPRPTMNEEILALCAAAADNTDSPDIGPPPVSRFVEGDTVKHSPTSRATGEDAPQSPRQSPTVSPPPKLDFDSQPPGSPEPQREWGQTAITEWTDRIPAEPLKPAPASQSIRAGSKRKYGDENEPIQMAVTQPGKGNAINEEPEKTFPARGSQKRRSMKQLPANRRERTGVRTPLALKSTNEHLSSPRKMNAGLLSEGKKEQTGDSKSSSIADGATSGKPLPRIDIPAPEPPAVVSVVLDAETALPSAVPSSPSTPDRLGREEMPHDTPPPADISSTGETSRPSRRARVPISYAEPNLRDKMRRPTKELLDAVTGEGKFAHRVAATTKQEDHQCAPASVSKARLEPGSATGSSTKTLPADEPTSTSQHQNTLSPLAQREAFPDILPSTVVTERRKRPSAVGSGIRESLAATEKPNTASVEPPAALPTNNQGRTQGASKKHKANTITAERSNNDSQQQQQQQEPGPMTMRSPPDIYDFATSSPSSETRGPRETSSGTKPAPARNSTAAAATSASRTRTARKSSMVAAAALRELLDEEDQEEDATFGRPVPPPPAPPPPHKSRSAGAARKRASMLEPKKSSMVAGAADAADEDANTSAVSSSSSSGGSAGADGGCGGGGARDRIARRRSMML